MIFKNDVLNVDPAARADARVVEAWIDLEDTAAAKRLTNLTVDVLITTSQTMGPPPRSWIATQRSPRRSGTDPRAASSRLAIAWRILMHEGPQYAGGAGIFIAVLMIFLQLGFYFSVPKGECGFTTVCGLISC
jgi:hypothetical protein